MWMGWVPHKPQTRTWGHTSTVSRGTTPRPCPCSHMASVSRVTPIPDPWLGHQVFADWAPVVEMSEFLWSPGLVDRSVGSVSLSQRSPPLFPSLLCDTNCFYSCDDNVEDTGSGSFVVLLRCCETHQKRGCKMMGRAALCWVPTVYWTRSQKQPQLLPLGFLPDPCALQSVAQVNLLPSRHTCAGELE